MRSLAKAGAWPVPAGWLVAMQPAGAAALLLSPTNSLCILTNMTVAGDYTVQLGSAMDSTW